MTKAEKVKYSIERCISHVPDACRDCAYDAGHPYNECVEMMLKDALELLKSQQSQIEYTKEFLRQTIVRCKDCNNRGTSDCPIEELCNGWIPSDDFFCADGERKEG